MKPTRVGDTWARFDDNTTWSLPPDYDDEGPTLEWTQRYGSDEAILKQRLVVASVLACYEALILLPSRARNERVKAIREAMKQRAAAGAAQLRRGEPGE